MLCRRRIVSFNVGSRAVACKEGACIQQRPARRLPILDSALASAGKVARWRLSAGVNAVQYRLVIWIGCRAGRDPDEKLQRSANFDLRIAAGRRRHSDVIEGLRHSPWRWIYWIGSIRARNNSMPARPNMARLSVFNRLIWPSAWPLLHGSAMAFLTASMSRFKIRANCCRARTPEWRASSSQEPSLPGSAPRRSPRNRIASLRMTTKLGEASFNTATLAA